MCRGREEVSKIQKGSVWRGRKTGRWLSRWEFVWPKKQHSGAKFSAVLWDSLWRKSGLGLVSGIVRYIRQFRIRTVTASAIRSRISCHPLGLSVPAVLHYPLRLARRRGRW
jgi:hypothetical protein